ncbi:MAG: hypothetical protein V1763_00840 [Parcubacteria group bacterium]
MDVTPVEFDEPVLSQDELVAGMKGNANWFLYKQDMKVVEPETKPQSEPLPTSGIDARTDSDCGGGV